jgi:hypothetical protein
MTPENPQNNLPSELRRRAVARLAARLRAAVSRCGSDMHRMLQEMEHYNIELEMQIDEMRREKESS